MQNFMEKIPIMISFINNKLSPIYTVIKEKFSLNCSFISESMNTPFNFFIFFSFISSFIFFFGELVCNLLGVLYPMFYGIRILKDQKTQSVNEQDESIMQENQFSPFVTIYKYFFLHGLMTVFETLFGFIFFLLPGYYFIKFTIIYLLVRNNLEMSDKVFEYVILMYKNYDMDNKLINISSMLRQRFLMLLKNLQKNQEQSTHPKVE